MTQVHHPVRSIYAKRQRQERQGRSSCDNCCPIRLMNVSMCAPYAALSNIVDINYKRRWVVIYKIISKTLTTATKVVVVVIPTMLTLIMMTIMANM